MQNKADTKETILLQQLLEHSYIEYGKDIEKAIYLVTELKRQMQITLAVVIIFWFAFSVTVILLLTKVFG